MSDDDNIRDEEEVDPDALEDEEEGDLDDGLLSADKLRDKELDEEEEVEDLEDDEEELDFESDEEEGF